MELLKIDSSKLEGILQELAYKTDELLLPFKEETEKAMEGIHIFNENTNKHLSELQAMNRDVEEIFRLKDQFAKTIGRIDSISDRFTAIEETIYSFKVRIDTLEKHGDMFEQKVKSKFKKLKNFLKQNNPEINSTRITDLENRYEVLNDMINQKTDQILGKQISDSDGMKREIELIRKEFNSEINKNKNTHKQELKIKDKGETDLDKKQIIPEESNEKNSCHEEAKIQDISKEILNEDTLNDPLYHSSSEIEHESNIIDPEEQSFGLMTKEISGQENSELVLEKIPLEYDKDNEETAKKILAIEDNLNDLRKNIEALNFKIDENIKNHLKDKTEYKDALDKLQETIYNNPSQTKVTNISTTAMVSQETEIPKQKLPHIKEFPLNDRESKLSIHVDAPKQEQDSSFRPNPGIDTTLNEKLNYYIKTNHNKCESLRSQIEALELNSDNLVAKMNSLMTSQAEMKVDINYKFALTKEPLSEERPIDLTPDIENLSSRIDTLESNLNQLSSAKEQIQFVPETTEPEKKDNLAGKVFAMAKKHEILIQKIQKQVRKLEEQVQKTTSSLRKDQKSEMNTNLKELETLRSRLSEVFLKVEEGNKLSKKDFHLITELSSVVDSKLDREEIYSKVDKDELKKAYRMLSSRIVHLQTELKKTKDSMVPPIKQGEAVIVKDNECLACGQDLHKSASVREWKPSGRFPSNFKSKFGPGFSNIVHMIPEVIDRLSPEPSGLRSSRPISEVPRTHSRNTKSQLRKTIKD